MVKCQYRKYCSELLIPRMLMEFKLFKHKQCDLYSFQDTLSYFVFKWTLKLLLLPFES